MFYIPENNWNFINEKRIKQLEQIYDKIDSFYPTEKNVLRFLENDFNNIQYIIVGMDPYPSSFIKEGVETPQATGRSFEVASISSWNEKFKQSSLRNILKTIYLNETGQKKSLEEIREEIKSGTFRILSPHEWYDNLEKQGVIFLNATLTVEPGKPNSHVSLWDAFMEDLIVHIDSNSDAKWLLWGNDAKKRVFDLVREDQCILSCHPRLAQFVDENCFAKTHNIDWKGCV